MLNISRSDLIICMGTTKNVVGLIKEAVEVIVEDKKLVTKEDLGFLPTRDEFNSRLDEVMGELKDIREEITMLSQHSRDNSGSIERLEKIHPQNSHSGFV